MEQRSEPPALFDLAWALHAGAGIAFLALLPDSTGVSVGIFLLMFVGGVLCGFLGKAWRVATPPPRLALACLLAFATVWLTVPLSTVRYQDLSPDAKAAWWSTYAIETVGEDQQPLSHSTAAVAGFPVRGLQGHDDDALYREWEDARQAGSMIGDSQWYTKRCIPLRRGAWVLWLDFLLWLLPIWGVLTRLPVRAVLVVYPVSLVMSLGGLVAAGHWFTHNAFDG